MKTKTWLEIGCAAGVGLAALLADGAATAANSRAAASDTMTVQAIAAMRPMMKEIMKQVHSTIKSGFESGVVMTQTRQNIVVNKELAPADFTR